MHAAGPRPSIDSMTRDTPSRTDRRTPLERTISIREGKKTEASSTTTSTAPGQGPAPTSLMTAATPESAPNANTSPSSDDQRPAEPISIQRPAPVAVIDPPPRCGTAFSEAQTLVRENSVRSRSSIAKLPLAGDGGAIGQQNNGGEGGGSAAVLPVRSIFPEYNPALPLAHQNYYPTQTSPTHIPPEAISRRLYSPTSDAHPDPTSPRNIHNNNNRPQSPPLRSPRSAASNTTTNANAAGRRWPPARANDAAAVRPAAAPEPSTTEQLRGYWKVANGWKAAASEGRVYTFKVACERDAPVYTLSSRAGQPFYRMRLDPTSASAYVSLARFDPSKTWKPPVPPKDNHNAGSAGAGGGGNGDGGGPVGGGEDGGSGAPAAAAVVMAGKGWQEVIATTLEVGAARRQASGDGLVSLLFPLAAARLASESRLATNAATLAAAERECARLVWDDDSGSHFLVHPALAMPFCVTIERNTAWSRTEYTLEHIESPQHLARLTRDGTGTGWLEVDTGIASKIDAVYLVDVAVAALVLVAHADGDFSRVEVFEPPPSLGSGRNSRQESKRGSRISRLSARIGSGDKKKAGKSRLEVFELDLESQASDLKKHSSKEKDGVPGCARAIISLLSVTFKCLIWCATIAFKALTGLISLLARCLTSEKL